MSATRKPVIVRKLSRDWCAGYAAPNPPFDDAEIELLDSSGKLLRILWKDVKWVCYVRELASDGIGVLSQDSSPPERLLRRRFSGRPRIAGLWMRLTLVDGDELEGVAANDRSLIEGAGLMLTPPDTRSNTQRIFIPRTSIRELTLLGVIAPATPARQRIAAQPELFSKGPSEDAAGETALDESLPELRPPIPFPIQSLS